MEKIGFLGMGVMGLPMAKNVVQKCGMPVLGYDVVQKQLDAFQAAGGIPVSDPVEIYKQCDVILQILPTHPIIRNSVEQAIQYGKPGNVIVDLSSTAPDIILELYEKTKAAGMYLLDSPVSGGNPMAIAGTLADVAVVTSADADHLDIYGTHEAVKEAFSQFVRQIRPGGSLIIKRGVDIVIDNPGIAVYRYSYDEPCDFYARNVQLLEGGHYCYDLVTPSGAFEGCTLGVPGWVNIENAVAAVASVWCAAKAGGTPLDADKLRGALASFSGVKRRFEFYVNTPKQVYMDDYAHHPRELAATLTSVRKMFPGRRITALFQPHLYTRTRDLHAEFAEALSHADEVVLLPIYPAREEPIPGITSEIIARRVAAPCRIVDRDHLADEVAAMDTDVVISFGAGNIDACCPALAERLKMKS
mgnify:CR=1 FL=1